MKDNIGSLTYIFQLAPLIRSTIRFLFNVLFVSDADLSISKYQHLCLLVNISHQTYWSEALKALTKQLYNESQDHQLADQTIHALNKNREGK